MVTPVIRNIATTSEIQFSGTDTIFRNNGTQIGKISPNGLEIDGKPISASGVFLSGGDIVPRDTSINVGLPPKPFNNIYLSESLYISGSTNFMTASYDNNNLLINGNAVVQSSSTGSMYAGGIITKAVDLNGNVTQPNNSKVLVGAVSFVGGNQSLTVTAFAPELIGHVQGDNMFITATYIGLSAPSSDIFTNLDSATGNLSIKITNSQPFNQDVSFMIVYFP